jgi:hypothetical protein
VAELTLDQQKALALARARQRAQAGAQGTPAATAAPQTLQQRSKDVFGFKDYAHRGTLLPLGRTREGKTELATPGIIRDMMESALLPGHVSKGGSYTPEDALRFTLDYAAPATAHKPTLTRKALTKSAPTTEQLKGQAKAFKTSAVESGTVVKPDSYLDLMTRMESAVTKNKINSTLHPRANEVYKILSDALGQDMDVEDLMVARRLIGVAQRSVTPELADERRIAGLMEDMLDDFVDNLKPADLVSGDPLKVGKNLTQFRSLWSRAKKSELIEGIMEKATTQASGFENGIRIGFRSLLNNKKQLRGFSPDEVKIMKEIVQGTSGQKLLRLLGKMSFGTRGGSNFLGGSIGAGAGAALGSEIAGPLGAGIGALAAPAVGYAAQKGADYGTRKGAELARAMAATGGRLPRGGPQQGVFNLLMQGAMPGAGTLVPRPPSLMDNKFAQRHGLENIF